MRLLEKRIQEVEQYQFKKPYKLEYLKKNVCEEIYLVAMIRYKEVSQYTVLLCQFGETVYWLLSTDSNSRYIYKQEAKDYNFNHILSIMSKRNR